MSHRDKHPRFFASGFTHTPFSPESTPLQHQRFKTPAKGSNFNEWPRYTPWRAHKKRWSRGAILLATRHVLQNPILWREFCIELLPQGSLAPKSGRLAQHNALQAHIRVYERPNASCTVEPYRPAERYCPEESPEAASCCAAVASEFCAAERASLRVWPSSVPKSTSLPLRLCSKASSSS